MFKRIRENLGWAVAGFVIAIPMAWAAAVIFSGDEVKTLKPNISLNDVVKWRTSAGDPEGSVAAPVGSLHSNTATGVVKRKASGTGSTGWSNVDPAAIGGTHINIREGENNEFDADVSGWTEGTTAATQETTAAEVAFGSGSLSWDTVGADTLVSSSIAVPEGLHDAACLLRAFIKDGDSNLKLQVYDGANVLAETTLQTYASYTEVRVPFVCPDSGTVAARLESTADAALVRMDQVYLGENFNVGTIVSGGEVVAIQRSPAVTGCQWTSTGTWADLGPITACGPNVAEYEAPGYDIDETDRNEIYLKMNNLPVGKYLAVFRYGNHWRNATAPGFGHCSIRTTVDGVNFSTVNSTELSDDLSMAGSVQLYYNNTTQQDVLFKVQDAAESASCVLFNQAQSGSQGVEAGWTLHRLGPSPQETVIFPEAQGFYIDVNIGGESLSLGTNNVLSYAPAGGGINLDMVINRGSKWDPRIPCSGSNPATGLTCAAGSERVGVEFDVPLAGVYEVCAEFGHEVADSNGGGIGWAAFQLVETGLTNETITQEGGGRQNTGIGFPAVNNLLVQHPVRTCGTFQFDSVGRRSIRLFYEQQASGITGHFLRIDRSSSNGQRDAKLTVKMITPFHNPGLIVKEEFQYDESAITGGGSATVNITRTDSSKKVRIMVMSNAASVGYFSVSKFSGTGPATCRWGIRRDGVYIARLQIQSGIGGGSTGDNIQYPGYYEYVDTAAGIGAISYDIVLEVAGSGSNCSIPGTKLVAMEIH